MFGTNSEPWMADAACTQIGGEPFFPEGSEHPGDAKSACRRCDVTEACLQYALLHKETHGIWGGLSYAERRKLRRAA